MSRSRILMGLAMASTLSATAWTGPLLPFTGPVGRYFLAGGDYIYVVQGNTVSKFPTVYHGDSDVWWSERVIAVSSTVRTRSGDLRFSPDLGEGEYTLTGIPTGHGYFTPPSGSNRVYDGTTDGVLNYFVDHGADPELGGIYVADYFWQNPEFLFCEGCDGLSGITYDPYNNSLWVLGRTGGITDYSLTGEFLAEFSLANAYPGLTVYSALALDPNDHTLWLVSSPFPPSPSPFYLLEQYSLAPATFGQLLQSGLPNGLPCCFQDGGEFSEEIVPEPVPLILVLTGLAGVIVARKLPRRVRLSVTRDFVALEERRFGQ